jgi:hypothetical protein
MKDKGISGFDPIKANGCGNGLLTDTAYGLGWRLRHGRGHGWADGFGGQLG